MGQVNREISVFSKKELVISPGTGRFKIKGGAAPPAAAQRMLQVVKLCVGLEREGAPLQGKNYSNKYIENIEK